MILPEMEKDRGQSSCPLNCPLCYLNKQEKTHEKTKREIVDRFGCIEIFEGFRIHNDNYLILFSNICFSVVNLGIFGLCSLRKSWLDIKNRLFIYLSYFSIVLTNKCLRNIDNSIPDGSDIRSTDSPLYLKSKINSYATWDFWKEWRRHTPRKPQDNTREKKKERIGPMPLFSLKADEYLPIAVTVRRKNPGIYFRVESSHNVKVYLMDDDGLRDYEDEDTEDFDTYFETLSSRFHEEEIDLPRGGEWHLIIENQRNLPIQGFYEVLT